MGLSLAETKAIQQIADLLYFYLPGKPHPFADQRISFAGVVYEYGLKDFWQGGSKGPAITAFLENTLEQKRDVFCSVILEIVRRGIKYRGNKGQPISREEIESLNELILKVRFKIPELWDKEFIESLPTSKQQKASEQAQEKEKVNQEKRKELVDRLLSVEKLLPHERGFAFERFLNETFDVFKLNPRNSFRLVGEQIDGSLELDGEIYLIEAKWESKPIGLQDLLYFHGKVTGKATWSRGLFISYSGITEDALTAFLKGRATNLITLSAQDLYFVLNGIGSTYLDLDEAIRIKVRHAAETGDVGMSAYAILMKMGENKCK